MFSDASKAECDRRSLQGSLIVNAFHRFSIAAVICAALVGPAAAATAGFSLNISTGGSLGGTGDQPGFRLTNLSDIGLTISSISFTIGDPGYNF
jgi:hypothetical protein